MKLINSLILLMIVSTLFLSCDRNSCNGDASLNVTLKNNSDSPIYYSFFWKSPDTSIGDENPAIYKTIISPKNSYTHGIGLGDCWVDMLVETSTQYVHFFNMDTIDQIPWEVVKKTQRGLLARKAINLEYLESHNWTIEYP